jgi:hypothetical protein
MHFHRSPVPAEQVPVEIGEDESFGQCFQSLLALAQLLVRPLALGRITHNRNEMRDRPLLATDGGNCVLVMVKTPVFAPVAEIAAPGPARGWLSKGSGKTPGHAART